MSDDYLRNYDQEAIDDQAGFDMHNDLPSYYRGMKQIEGAWEDVAQRRQLFAQFGIRDEPHYHQVQATHDRYIQSPAAAAQYGGIDQIMQLQMNTIQQMVMDQMQQRAQTDLAGEFAPVEGVDLDSWAGAQAKIASGGTLDQILPVLGIDQACWERVSAEWNARMARDTTATIATAYGKAFTSGGQGAFAGAGAAGAAAMGSTASPDGQPPIPLEQYVEIMEAQGAAAEQGRDPNEVLAGFGMSAIDWANVGSWYSQYLNKNFMLDGQKLLHRYNELTEFYKAKYASPSADGDLEY
jgi:hypothetical protein